MNQKRLTIHSPTEIAFSISQKIKMQENIGDNYDLALYDNKTG